MIILDSSYDELDDKIERLSDSDEYGEEVLVSVNDDEAIVLFEPAWRITDKNLIAVEGIYGNYDQKARNFKPDWALTAIYDNVPDGDFDIENWLYLEQDSPVMTIHNYLYLINGGKNVEKRNN